MRETNNVNSCVIDTTKKGSRDLDFYRKVVYTSYTNDDDNRTYKLQYSHLWNTNIIQNVSTKIFLLLRSSLQKAQGFIL